MAQSRQPAKRGGNNQVATAEDVKAKLKQDAQDIKERVSAPETNAIRLKDKMFTFPDGQVFTDSIEMVIVDFLAWNSYYTEEFNPKDFKPPVCWAAAERLSDMAPSANAPEPQSDSCSTCWANEFESGKGNAKACKNQRRLALLPANSNDPNSAPMHTMMVPPSSLKKFDAFVNTVARIYELPPVGVTCTIRMHPESSYTQLLFESPQPNEDIAAHYNRLQEARELISVEPDLSNYEPPKKQTKSRGGQRAKR